MMNFLDISFKKEPNQPFMDYISSLENHIFSVASKLNEVITTVNNLECNKVNLYEVQNVMAELENLKDDFQNFSKNISQSKS